MNKMSQSALSIAVILLYYARYCHGFHFISL